jgi:hypothetical protein
MEDSIEATGRRAEPRRRFGIGLFGGPSGILPPDAHVQRRLNSQTHAIAANSNDRDSYPAIDNQLFANFASQDQHTITLPAIRFLVSVFFAEISGSS